MGTKCCLINRQNKHKNNLLKLHRSLISPNFWLQNFFHSFMFLMINWISRPSIVHTPHTPTPPHTNKQTKQNKTKTHTHTPTWPGIQSEDTIYTRVYSVFVPAFKARTNLCITHSKWGHFFTHLWTCLARTKRGLRPYPPHPYYGRGRTVHIVTKRGLKFWPRFVKMSSLWM